MPDLAICESPVALELANHFIHYRQNLEQVTKQLRQFKTIADVCPLPMFISDSEGRCQYVNRLYTELTGASVQAAQNYGWQKFLAPKSLNEMIKHWKDAITNHSSYEAIEEFIRPDGIATKAMVKATKIPDDGWVGFCIPIHS